MAKQDELKKVEMLGQKATELQQRRADRKTKIPFVNINIGTSLWPSAGPVQTAPSPASVTTDRSSDRSSAMGTSGRIENSMMGVLNLQIERLTSELQRKGEELIQERERADRLEKEVAESVQPATGSNKASDEDLQRIQSELREEKQRADDAMASIDRLRSSSSSQSSAALIASEEEVGKLKEDLRRKDKVKMIFVFVACFFDLKRIFRRLRLRIRRLWW
jgi:hypothetical protein